MTDTRAAFEAHFQLSQRQAKRDNAGEYIDEFVRNKWEGWQAALPKLDGDDEVLFPNDTGLAIIHAGRYWKLREAEQDAARYRFEQEREYQDYLHHSKVMGLQPMPLEEYREKSDAITDAAMQECA